MVRTRSILMPEGKASPRAFFVQSVSDEALSFLCDPGRVLEYGCRVAVQITPEANWQPGVLKTRNPSRAKRLHACVTLLNGPKIDLDTLEHDQVVRIIAEYRDL